MVCRRSAGTSASAAGTPADLILFYNGADMTTLADSGLFVDLNTYLEADSEWASHIKADALAAGQQDGVQYCIPYIGFYEGRYDFLNCPGGICNGITGGLHDEEGIGFVTRPTEEVSDNWRWAEQWIPHASWYLYAMALKFE